MNLRITLDDVEVGQILDDLNISAKSWERTAEYLRTQELPTDDSYLLEECSNPEEADAMAHRYRSIIAKIRSQILKA